VRAPKRWPKKVKPSNALTSHRAARWSRSKWTRSPRPAPGEFGVLPGMCFHDRAQACVLFYRTRKAALSRRGDGVLQVAHSGRATRSRCCGSGRAARDIDRDTAAQELAAVDAELAKTKAETAAEVKALLGKRAWAARESMRRIG